MTLKELSKVYYLTKIIEHDSMEIETIEEKLTNTSPSLTGMPHGGGVHDKMWENVPELVERKRQLEQRRKKLQDTKNRIRDWIEEIEDPQVQILMTYRFVDLLPWQEVAFKAGGNNSEDSVKKMVYRFIKKGVKA